MFGIDDPSIWSVYLLCILSAAVCVGYGAAKWNQGDESPSSEDVTWVKDEKEMEEKM